MSSNDEPSAQSSLSNQDLSETRTSLDSERSLNLSPDASVNDTAVNGHTSIRDEDETETDPIIKLQRELERTREEKDTLAAQYRNLLAKLTTMRATLGNKLKQDAEELDRREQLVQQLNMENDDLKSTVETLKQELVASHEEAERASRELDAIRSRALEESAQESLIRERDLREAQTDLERCRIEREEWERVALQERAMAEEYRSSVESYKRELELEQEIRQKGSLELEAERGKADNLQSVLQDFQASKDHELKQAVKAYETQLTQVTQSLAEFKSRALNAELQLEESQTNSSKTHSLEKEVKEKNLLIGKLRHEAVIINEHLMEALRRLRRSSSDTNVDRRLITNVLLSFLNTERADPKRFEILSLIATILSWTDAEREKAGLQRATSGQTSAPSFWSRSSSANNSPAKSMELDKTDETESFSRLWVEFLLTEAASGESVSSRNPGSPPSRNNNSLPGTPTSGVYPTGPPKSSANSRRFASHTTPSANSMAVASSPNLLLAQPPLKKGKERDIRS